MIKTAMSEPTPEDLRDRLIESIMGALKTPRPSLGPAPSAHRRTALFVTGAIVTLAALVTVLLLAPSSTSDFALADVVEAMGGVEKDHGKNRRSKWEFRSHPL